MYQVSQEYKKSMKSPVRNATHMVVSIGMINQDAQRSASVENKSDFIWFSNLSEIFNDSWNGTQYATYEQDFFKADGTMMFPPENRKDYSKHGLIQEHLFQNSFSMKFTFGCGKADIKGLTIQFGENYPTKFTILTDSGVETDFKNDSSYFETETVFNNTEYITIKVISMLKPNGRVRINYIKFGLGLEYDNEWIKTADSKATLSMIDDDLPQVEFSVTLKNDDHTLDIDNPESSMNFFESGQEMLVTIGYELDSGEIEWMQLHSLHLSEWSSDNDSATIKAVDRLQYMNTSYYKGRYYENGISLYDLARAVLADAGIDEDEYSIDDYLKSVTVKNPLPNVGHKEALQIIANAGRCTLSYNRYGKINIESAFIPSFKTSTSETVYFSDGETVDIGTEKSRYATYEKNYLVANGEMLFPPRKSLGTGGFISEQCSDDNCTFAENPIITRTFETKFNVYTIPIKFQENPVTDFIIRAYANGELVDTYLVENNSLLYTEVSHAFLEFDKLEIEFIKTKVPNSRVKIDYISPGTEVDYQIRIDDLWSMPTGTQLERIENLKVSRTMYSKSQTQEELTSDTLVYNGDSLIYYFRDPCYGYSVEPSKGSVQIIGFGCYYIEFSLSGITSGTEIAISIKGYKYNTSIAYCTKQIGNRGNDKEWNNPLLSDADHSQKVTEWLCGYYSSPYEYDLDFRGEPALDVGDTVYQENRYDEKQKVLIEELSLKFDKTIRSSVKTRRK